MKKQILAISLGLMTFGVFAQKSELKDIDRAIDKNDFKTAKEGISALEKDESAIEEKYQAWYYYLKGSAYGKSNIKKAAEAYNKLFDIEKASNSSKYTKEAEPKLNQLIKSVSDQAINAYNNDKNYELATENFYLTYQLSPNDTAYLYNAAVSASLAKEYDKSLEYYKKLQDLGYTGIETEYYAVEKETGEERKFNTKDDRAVMLKFGTYTNPTEKTSESKEADIVKNIGFVLIALGRTDEAIVAIQEARKSNPKDLNLIMNEAQLYIKLEKMDKFGKLMEEAIALDPNNPVLYFNLGVVNQNEKKLDEAMKYYKKAIELKPDYGDAYMNLAITILDGEQEIIDEMNKNLSNFKKYDELEKKQKALYLEALPFLEKADEIKRTPDTVKSLLNIYDNLLMTDKADALRPIYKKMIGQ